MKNATARPVQSAPIAIEDIAFEGNGLVRPECVLATRAGDLYTSDWRGGVAQLRADGSQALYAGTLPDGRAARPNGIAMRKNGNFLFADLGETQGGVYELGRDGSVRAFVLRVDGVDLPPSNFVHEDARGRVWITVSTRQVPRAAAYRAQVADGFIVLCDSQGPRVVADGLGYTNEALPSPDGQYLYVNETFTRRLTRFRIASGGGLNSREVVCDFGPGTYPDGLAFDAEGGVWITSVVSNRVIRVAPDGSQQLMLEDCDAAHLAWVEGAYQAGTMGRPHLDAVKSRRLKNVSSLAFGGPDLRTAYLGCLLGDTIATFRSPIAGAPPVHWDY
ncbi:MAG: SMP-30/gluconolactonase/LRE family protein [Betaproteobacteria bacterium]